jgi:aspartate kinase
MITIEKIGGTSMRALPHILKNFQFFSSSGAAVYNRVFVVSAFSGVTDLLLENKKTGQPGVYHRFADYKDFRQALQEVAASLKGINQDFEAIGLDLIAANAFITRRIGEAQQFLENLSNVLASGYMCADNILLAAREILASIGEAHAAFNFVNILRNNGLKATLIDLSGFHDHEPYTIDERIVQAFKNIAFQNTICVATGYTKGTEGIMREFDRGYSEVTFSKIAVALKPKEAIIYKEYHLSSADPNLVGAANCIPVEFTNYDVADQLADVGMEAIHPKASKPLEINNINLRIKNTFEPHHPGTLITKNYVCPHKRVEVITGTDKVVIVDVYDPLMVGTVGEDLKIMTVFSKYQISYILKTTSANSISMVIWEKDFRQDLLVELQALFQEVKIEPVAIVCTIGSNIDQPGVLAKAAEALAREGINIICAGFSLRKVNAQFIVARSDYKNAIIALNKTMFF